MKAKNAIVTEVKARVGDRQAIRVVNRGRRTAPYPDGSIGSDLPKRNYIKYLVERYHHCREADITSGRTARLHYATVFKDIETKFKAPTYFIPERRFEELVDFLHARIDNTILGRRINARGMSNFESFDEYKMKQAPPSET